MRSTKLANSQLVPLLEGGAYGSLGAADLHEIGIETVAIDVLELSIEVGIEEIQARGGINGWLSWQGPVLALYRTGASAPPGTGWRAHALPQLIRERDGEMTLKSSVDGRAIKTTRARILESARSIGAVPTAQLDEFGVRIGLWDDPGAPPPEEELVVSALAASQGRRGRRLDGGAWRDVDATGAVACDCRACGIASPELLVHMWRSREITATHLLTWHNLHQTRLLVQ